MPRQYSPKTFLRQAPNALLRRYLQKHEIGEDLPWDHLPETEIDLVFKTIEAAPETMRRRIDRDLREIYEMADEGGVKTLIEEGREPVHSLYLAETLGEMKGHLEPAFWVFLEHPKVFAVAQQFHHADHLTARSWRKRKDLPPAEPSTDAHSSQRLADVISAYYHQKEGRGRGCQVDHYRRGDRLYWFAYPEDYAEGRLIYDEQHRLLLQTQRPAFEVIFVHDPKEQSLDLFARGDRRTVGDLQRVFGRAILGVELEDPEAPEATYELNGLLSRDFPLPLEPGDGVEQVRVRRLRLGIMGREYKRITLEANVRDNPKAIYGLLDDVLAGQRIPRDLLTVVGVNLQMAFRAVAGNRSRTLSFDVSYPDSCSLKYDPKHETAKALLKRWGIDGSGRTQKDPASRRRPVQLHNRV